MNNEKFVSVEDVKKELDNLYMVSKEVLKNNNPKLNLGVLEILKETMSRTELMDMDKRYLRKFKTLIKNIEENYELPKS